MTKENVMPNKIKYNIIKDERENRYFNLPIVQDFIKNIPMKTSKPPSEKQRLKLEGSGPFSKFWLNVNWKRCNTVLLRMQHKIHTNYTDCRELQEQILISPIIKLLAVRTVAFTNSGKKTAGIDGIKQLTHFQAVTLAISLKIDGKATSIRRIWIPKPGTTEKRPLGIPTIKDRAKQWLVKYALEPQWDRQFSPRTFGFRPGRSAHDAVWNVRNVLKTGPRYIYDADIEKCFDKISHNYLIDKLGFKYTDPIALQIRSWLRAGILDSKNQNFTIPSMGTAQGGVISPLLCNIALHGMEEFIVKYLKSKAIRFDNIGKCKLYTYADDFVFMCSQKRTFFLAIEAIDLFLIPIGLNIKLKKTRKIHTVNRAITYTIERIEKIGEDGNYIFKEDETYLPILYGSTYKFPVNNTFKFLGFKFYCYSVGKHHSIKINRYKISNTAVLAIPTTEATKKHFNVIRSKLRKFVKPLDIVTNISPIIRGWLNYFGKSDLRTANKVGKLRTRMTLMLLNWQKRVFGTRKRTPERWAKINNDKWNFFALDPKSGTKKFLPRHSDYNFSLIRYKPIRSSSCFFDGNMSYWSIRLKSVLELSPGDTKIIPKQKGLCYKCGRSFSIFDDAKVIIERKTKYNKENKTSGKGNTRRVVHSICQ